MTFPPDPIADGKTPGAPAYRTEHPDHHNALASAINDTVAKVVEIEASAVTPAADATFVYKVAHDAVTGWPARPAVGTDTVWWYADLTGVPEPADAEPQDIVQVIVEEQYVARIVDSATPQPRPDSDGPVLWADDSTNAIAGDFVWVAD